MNLFPLAFTSICFLGTAGGQKPTAQEVVLQKELEITQADASGLVQHMKGVKKYDDEIYAKSDVSPAKARSMTSEDLILQTVKSGLTVTFLLYSKPVIGVYRATLSAPSLKELCKRNDLGTAFAGAYLRMPLDPKTNKRFEKEGWVMGLNTVDALVCYPPIRRKLAGHEKDIILAMAHDLETEKTVNHRYKPGKEPFGTFFDNVGAAETLLEQANPHLKVDLSKHPKPDEAMQEIVKRAKSLP